MEIPRRTVRASAPAATLAAVLAVMLLTPALASASVSPLPRSDYTVKALCSKPAARRAACAAFKLLPRSAAARARRHPLGIRRAVALAAPSPREGAFGLRPQDLHTAYALRDSASSQQTIALVDAYNDPNAEADLGGYAEEFSLPQCTAAGGCFEQVNEKGETGNLPFPKTVKELESARKGTRAQREEAEEASGWGVEISLDIETAHATCQSCKILLVEASSPTLGDLETAERSAETLGATEISNSWSAPEFSETPAGENASPFNHAGTVIAASSGDDGYLNWDGTSGSKGYANYPASSPHVVAVGGTRLSLGAGGAWAGEAVWNGDGATGGGCSIVFAAPPWQQEISNWAAVGCAGKRAVSDVSADADPYTGLAVHDTDPECEYRYTQAGVEHVLYWCTIGGTSLSSPLIASVFALAGGAGGVAYPADTLYTHELESPESLHDVTSGSNGECTKPFLEGGLSGCTATEEAEKSCAAKAICLARAGYDGPTGLGTPDGLAAFNTVAVPIVATEAASSVTQTGATLHGTVDPNGAEVSSCKFEYGIELPSGKSVSCSPSPGAGASPVSVSATVTALTPHSSYVFRISATNAGGPSDGAPESFTTLAGVDYGTCTKAATVERRHTGAYDDKNCTLADAAQEGRYEWTSAPAELDVPILAKARNVTLRSALVSISCKTATLEGMVTGPSSTTETITFARCTSAGAKCTSTGEAEGAIRTALLDGSLLLSGEHGASTRLQSSGADLADFACGGVDYALSGGIAGIDSCNVNVMVKKTCETFAEGVGEQALSLEILGGASEPALASFEAKGKSPVALEIKRF